MQVVFSNHALERVKERTQQFIDYHRQVLSVFLQRAGLSDEPTRVKVLDYVYVIAKVRRKGNYYRVITMRVG